MFDPFITLVRGWHVYARQSVVFAGVSLSCLFMTVLALDSVSVGESVCYRPRTVVPGVCDSVRGETVGGGGKVEDTSCPGPTWARGGGGGYPNQVTLPPSPQLGLFQHDEDGGGGRYCLV